MKLFEKSPPPLTTKQSHILSEVKTRWLDFLASQKPTDSETVEERINYFYEISNLPAPEIIWQTTIKDAHCFVAKNKGNLGVPIVNSFQVEVKYRDLISKIPSDLKDATNEEFSPILLESMVNHQLFAKTQDSIYFSRSDARKASIRKWFGNAAGDLIGELNDWALQAGIYSYDHMYRFARLDYYHSILLVEDPWFLALVDVAKCACYWWFFESKVIVVGYPKSLDSTEKEAIRAQLTKRPSLMEALPFVLLILAGTFAALTVLFFAVQPLLESSVPEQDSYKEPVDFD